MTAYSHFCSLYNRQLLDAASDAIEEGKSPDWPRVLFHVEQQDIALPGWAALQQLIEDAEKDGRELFSPRGDLGRELWSQIVTLPESIATLRRVKVFDLYGSSLLRIPPEIGQMENLEAFDPYTSYGLHWFPYEITNCKRLKKSRVSTRALYGNYKFRPSFPGLDPSVPQLVPKQCSVCGTNLAGHEVFQRWLSLRVATDVLPLLVNACSEKCISHLPAGAPGYIQAPHAGGPKIKQPIDPLPMRKFHLADSSGPTFTPSGSGKLGGVSKLPLLKANVPPWKAEEQKKQREASLAISSRKAARLLLTVANTFFIAGRGLMVAPGPLHDQYAGPSQVEAELRKPDGSVIQATLTIQWIFQTPPPKELRWGCMFTKLTKSDVPIGTEIWI